MAPNWAIVEIFVGIFHANEVAANDGDGICREFCITLSNSANVALYLSFLLLEHGRYAEITNSLLILLALSRKCSSSTMIQVAPAIYLGHISCGWPAIFHARMASGDKMIPTPPLVWLLDFAPWERKSTLSISRLVLLSDHVSWVNRMDGVSLNDLRILTMWSFLELDCLLE
jgi:hypothetical protein